VVYDVRFHAYSRNPNYTKKSISEVVQNNNIKYLHFPELGIPPEMRRYTPTNVWVYNVLFDKYENEILSKEIAQKRIDHVVDNVVRGETVVLMCMELNVDFCHRKRLAEIIAKRAGVAVKDIS
jgi:uncharacterized protein (DUF488 family)